MHTKSTTWVCRLSCLVILLSVILQLGKINFTVLALPKGVSLPANKVIYYPFDEQTVLHP